MKLWLNKAHNIGNQRNKLQFITCLRILVNERAQKCHIDDGIYRIHCSHSKANKNTNSNKTHHNS